LLSVKRTNKESKTKPEYKKLINNIAKPIENKTYDFDFFDLIRLNIPHIKPRVNHIITVKAFITPIAEGICNKYDLILNSFNLNLNTKLIYFENYII